MGVACKLTRESQNTQSNWIKFRALLTEGGAYRLAFVDY
jgi:hypothetical protein